MPPAYLDEKLLVQRVEDIFQNYFAVAEFFLTVPAPVPGNEAWAHAPEAKVSYWEQGVCREERALGILSELYVTLVLLPHQPHWTWQQLRRKINRISHLKWS